MSLSNNKILEKIFKFLYNLDESIKEMIHKWSKLNITKDLEHVRKGDKLSFSIKKLRNHELPEPINLIDIIKKRN